MELFIRKLTKKSKYSYIISIPKQLIDAFGWRERQKLELKPKPKSQKITIQDWGPKKKKA